MDYRQLPLGFQRYSLIDQQRFVTRMVTVLQAVQQGVGLETGPFPAQKISSLQDALETIERMNNTLI